jgi:hypothetical protein
MSASVPERRSPSMKGRKRIRVGESQTTTCPLCASNRFCAAPGRAPSGVPLRCTLDPGHAGEHVACGEKVDEHPIFRWPQPVETERKRRRGSMR